MSAGGYIPLIADLSIEIGRWITKHAGVSPKRVRVPESVMQAIKDEASSAWFIKDDKLAGKTTIHGVEIVADATLTIGRFDP